PDRSVVRIPNGIAMDEFTPASPGEKATLRRDLDLPDATIVMYTGKLNRGKGLELLLQVWDELVPEHPEAHLVLVGSGHHQALSIEPQLRSFVRTRSLEDRVTFTGETDRVADYLKAADLFVMPSESESQCLSLIEAMATGLPAVATAVGGIPEYFEDGRHGVLVDPQDAEALARGLRTLLDEDGARPEQGRAARESVLGQFRMEGVARRHERLFEELSG
ncbi:MAG: glycosyltransferase family 4 protein, partial [Gemmatimonadota bacterium]